MKTTSLLLCLLAATGAAFGEAEKTSPKAVYANPVLAGDFPDPSIVRDGEDYWATATAAEWAPLFPILHSRDLVNWRLKGYVFQEPPKWSSQNYWAPEICRFNGRWHIYYVGRKSGKGGVLHLAVATADHPAGPWTDHGPMIGQPEGSIDAAVATDEQGRPYLLWKNDGNSRNQPTFIFAQPLSPDGLRLEGEMKTLFRNDAAWEGNLVEGPFVLRRDGWFYIFYAGNGCCGKGCTYATGVARSRKLLGPYEKNPKNPVMAGNAEWKCPGHGSIVSTPDGRDFFLYHAYHAKGTVYIGRQGMLDEIKWDADGWPSINEGRGPGLSAPSPFDAPRNSRRGFFDDFDGPELDFRWQWPVPRKPRCVLTNGWLELAAHRTGRTDDPFVSALAAHTTSTDYTATAVVDAQSPVAGSRAGLVAYGDPGNLVGAVLCDGKISVIRRQRGADAMLAVMDAPKQERLLLRMEARDGHLFRFSAWDGSCWQSVGDALDIEGDYLPPWDRGVRVAVTCGGPENAVARFDWVRVVSE